MGFKLDQKQVLLRAAIHPLLAKARGQRCIAMDGGAVMECA